MKTVAVALVVVASAVALAAPTIALPPEDLAAYCRAVYPQIPFQVRCMSLERASQDRIAAARSAVDKTTWDRCQNGSASWSAMESCLAQPATASAPAPGSVIPPAGGGASEPADDRAEARRQGGEGGGAPASGEARTAPGAPATAPPPAASASGSGSTIILGPQANPALAAPPDNRPSRPVSEAEADRQLRNVLERTGETSARCTKRQYGPGWVIVCD
jgi:hypothetical protein